MTCSRKLRHFVLAIRGKKVNSKMLSEILTLRVKVAERLRFLEMMFSLFSDIVYLYKMPRYLSVRAKTRGQNRTSLNFNVRVLVDLHVIRLHLDKFKKKNHL